MYEIRLLIEGEQTAYRARWDSSQGQRSEPFPLTLPLGEKDRAELRWYLEEYLQFPGAGDEARAEGVEQQLADWGRALFDAAFGTAEGRDVYHNLMAAAPSERGVITLGTKDSFVLGQPWELMRDARGPLAFRGVTFRRQLEGTRPAVRYDLGLPLRVLLIVSRPADAGFIDPRHSTGPLLEALSELPAGQVELGFCDPPTFERLEELISQARRQGRPYHIVHFDGHGAYLPRTGVGALAFEREDAATRLVPGRDLGDLLSRCEVPLAVLEACRTADLSRQPVFGSVAPALLEAGVGSVVAFSHAVHIRAARLLVERFYRELCAGCTVGEALEEARARLHADRVRPLYRGPDAPAVELQDWFIPQLYQVGADPALVRRRPARRGKGEAMPHAYTPESAALPGFPPPPLYRFHGRALELLRLERAFRAHPAVALTGMGGMGKTALAREAAAWWRRTGRFEAAVFHSFEQKAGAERVVQLLGEALASEDFSALPAEAQWRTAVQLFHERRVLLVWDNFESTLPIYQQGEETMLSFGPEARAKLLQLYRELTEGNPAGRLLVTCRPGETRLPGIAEQALSGLARPDSLELLAAVLEVKGIERKGLDRAEVEKLLDLLADQPLAVQLVAPHLKALSPRQIMDDFRALLACFQDEGAPEGRNRSLLASLAFSVQRLSPQAQAALPYLAWFEGGVFERSFLDFAKLDEDAWQPVRAELVATALVSVEDLPQFNTPYLRFHPTLPYAATREETEELAERFVAVYLHVMQMAYGALHGRQPAAGMALEAREERNLRTAMMLAFARGARQAGAGFADTLGVYLQMAGRLGERDRLAAWVRGQVGEGALDEAACNVILNHAWTLFTQGHSTEAITAVQGLLDRLEREGLAEGKDPAFQLALGYRNLGRIYVNANRSDLALLPLQRTIELFARLPGEAAQGNLAVALGDLASAHQGLGHYREALAAAERALGIDRTLGREQAVSADLGRVAAILTDQQCYPEAEARYKEALATAKRAGDVQLQATVLQHWGRLEDCQGHHDRAVIFYRRAMAFFHRTGNRAGEMSTCNLLATAEMLRGQFEAAAAWYSRCRELATELGDVAQLAIIAGNEGTLYQRRAEGREDPEERALLLRQAVASAQECLATNLKRQDQVWVAQAYSQLGVLYRMLGELEAAQQHLLQGLAIYEALSLPEVYKVYWDLADVARDRGDAEAAAHWQAKHDAKLAELERLRRGEGTGAERKPGADEQFAAAILALAQAAYAARQAGQALEPDAAEALAALEQWPAPFSAIAPFLRAAAEGRALPPVPPGLPEGVARVLQALARAV